jgi:hypothetical protein
MSVRKRFRPAKAAPLLQSFLPQAFFSKLTSRADNAHKMSLSRWDSVRSGQAVAVRPLGKILKYPLDKFFDSDNTEVSA